MIRTRELGQVLDFLDAASPKVAGLVPAEARHFSIFDRRVGIEELRRSITDSVAPA